MARHRARVSALGLVGAVLAPRGEDDGGRAQRDEGHGGGLGAVGVGVGEGDGGQQDGPHEGEEAHGALHGWVLQCAIRAAHAAGWRCS